MRANRLPPLAVAALLSVLAACSSGGTSPVNVPDGGSPSGSPVLSLSRSTVELSSDTVASGAQLTVHFLAVDSDGKPFTGDLTVTFRTEGGTSTGSFSPVSREGTSGYQATFTGEASGTAVQVVAEVAGSQLTSAAPSLTVVPGPASAASSTVTLGAPTLAAGDTTVVTLTTRDAFGNALTTGGHAVAFALSGGASSGSFSAVTDNGDGTYSSTFSATTAGSASAVGATLDGSAVGAPSSPPSLTVLPGAASLAQSAVSVSGATVASGEAVTVTLTAIDAFGNRLDGGGLAVAFGTSGGTSTGSFSAITDHGDGTYSAQLTGALAGTATAITATLGGSPVTSAMPSVTVIPGGASPARSVVTVSSGTVQSGGSITVTLTANDAAGNREPTGGLPVTFATSGGASTGMFSAVTDHGDGTYSASFTGVLAGTPTSITATLGGATVTSAPPEVSVTPGAASPSQSRVSLSAATVQSGATITATLTARDAAGNPETTGGLAVSFALSGGTSTGSFSAVIDHGDGTYSAIFTGALAGSAATVGATLGGTAVTGPLPSVSVTPGPASLAESAVAVSSGTVQAGDSITVTLTAKDATGNSETSGGLAVSFVTSGGTSDGSFSSVTDHGDGTYSALFTGGTSGTATTIVGKIAGTALTSAAPQVVVSTGPVSLAQSRVTASGASVQSGASITVTLSAKDAAGNPETTGGLSVSFGISGGTSTGSFSAVTDHGDGTYSATFTGVLAGTATTITATLGGSAVTSALPQVTVTPGAASLSRSLVSTSSGTVQSGSSITVTLSAKDAAGNPETTGGLSVAFSATGGTSTGSFSAVSDHGDGTYSASFTGALAGTATTITASIGGSAVTSALPQVTVEPGAASLDQSVVSVSSGTVQAGSSITATLTAKDAAGNPETSGGLAVSFVTSGGTGSGSFSAVTDQGDGTYTATFTGGTSGSGLSIVGQIGGVNLTSAAPTVSVTTGPVSLAMSTVSVSSPTVQRTSTVTLTLTAKDAGGNQEAQGGLAVAFTLAGGSSAGSLSAVTDHGDGTYTATFTGTVPGTALTVGATIGGQAVTSALPTLTVTPGPASTSQSVVTVSSGTVASGASITATVIARDSAGYQETSGGLTVQFGWIYGTSTGSFSAVTDHGDGTYTATFTGVHAGTATSIIASINGTTLTSARPSVTVTPGPAAASTSYVTASKSSVSIGDSLGVTLTAEDAAGNRENTGGLAVTFITSGGSSGGTFSATTDNGDGTYSATFTGTASGTPTQLVGELSGSALTTAAPTVGVAGTADPAHSLITVSAPSLPIGATISVQLAARDQFDNPESKGGSTVAFSTSGGTSTGTLGAVTDNGDGTYSAPFTGTGVGTPLSVGATLDGAAVTTVQPTVFVRAGDNLVVPIEMTQRILASSATVATVFNRTLTSFDTNDYDGTVTYAFEVVGSNGDSAVHTVDIVDSSGVSRGSASFPAAVFKGSGPLRREVGTFTPNAGADTYRVRLSATAGGPYLNVQAARIVVTQTNATRTRLYFPLAGYDEDTFNNATADDGTAAVDSSNGSAPSQGTHSFYEAYRRVRSALAQLAAGTPWTLEAVLSGSSSSAVLKDTTSGAVIATSAPVTSGSPTLSSVDFDDSGFTDGDLYEAFLASATGGFTTLYKAGLWVRLDPLQKGDVCFKVAGKMNAGNGTQTTFDWLQEIDTSLFTEPAVSFQVDGSNAGTVNLTDCGPTDQIASCKTTAVPGSTLSGLSGATSVQRSAPFSVIDGDRFGVTGSSSLPTAQVRNACVFVSFE